MGGRVIKVRSPQPEPLPSVAPRGNPSSTELDFVPRTAWEHRLQELLDFRKIHGHVNVPRFWPLHPKLSNWVSNQRRLIRLGLLRADRARRLESLGVCWEGAEARREAQQETWDRMFGALRTFRRSFGHLEVPRGWSVEPSLAAWLASQRHLWRSGTLPAERSKRLLELDAEWHRGKSRPASLPRPRPAGGRRQAAWERRFAALSAYKESHGHCNVPARWAEDRDLAQWVVLQRVLRRRGRLDADRQARLSRLGFTWSGLDLKRAARDGRWDERFTQLSAFVALHGHSSVPLSGGAPEGLASWVFRQRNERRRGTLSTDRIRRLDSLSFAWELPKNGKAGRAHSWEARFSQLEEYARKHGGVSSLEGATGSLAQWLGGQRRRQRRGLLAQPLAQRLEALGVRWSMRDDRWDARFADLLAYRHRHGDCAVKMGDSSDRRLARWVSAQRTARKSGRLDADRARKLEAAGFLWSARPPVKPSRA